MASAPRNDLLTISDLAERTGVPPATLRSWEARYGFPRPIRLTGGHRRYAEPDVAAVLEVLRHRRSGLSLEAAVRRATSESGQPRSIYAELRRQHPELTPQSLSKASLVSLSRAIEHECCACAEQPLLFGGFQREVFLRASYARWVELARTARATVVFADLDDPPPPRPGIPIEVALPRAAPGRASAGSVGSAGSARWGTMGSRIRRGADPTRSGWVRWRQRWWTRCGRTSPPGRSQAAWARAAPSPCSW